MFKTEAESNLDDSELGGSGTSHTHVYPNDLSGTTWYMPSSSNHMGTQAIPQNGLYGTIPNVIWNFFQTDDSDPILTAPIFDDATYNALEGTYVNIKYKNESDFDS